MYSTLLGGMSVQDFLKDHWQKKPLLVRRAFPDFQDPLTPNELAGLAMEPDIKARLVFEKGRRPWQLFHGPFTESRLRRLPKSHWSLLVSRVNEYSEDAARILDNFSFIPHWRCDDLMVSFAPPHGTVGPHLDSYDVFLIQGQGSRRWQIQSAPKSALIPHLDLKILKDFKAEDEWILEPGDMLYLPPGVAHYGVALEECMTYSVGFRAPSKAQLWQEFYQCPEHLLAGLSGEALYEDPDLTLQSNPGLIAPDALARLTSILAEPLSHPEVMARWLASYLTRDHGADTSPHKRRRLSPKDVEARLSVSMVWRHDEVRMAYLAPEHKRFALFVGGEEHDLDVRLLPLVQELCASREINGSLVLKRLPKSAKLREGALTFVSELIRVGVLSLKRT